VETLWAIVTLPPRDGLVVALASALLIWYRLRLALPAPLGGLRLLRGRVESEPDAAWSPEAAGAARSLHLVSLFRRAAAHAVVGRSCLPRSLALSRLLDLYGLPSRVRIGLRQTDEGFAGHAWVEHHGAVIADRDEFVRAFAPLSFGHPCLEDAE
jgi:hypothetical protein